MTLFTISHSLFSFFVGDSESISLCVGIAIGAVGSYYCIKQWTPRRVDKLKECLLDSLCTFLGCNPYAKPMNDNGSKVSTTVPQNIVPDPWTYEGPKKGGVETVNLGTTSCAGQTGPAIVGGPYCSFPNIVAPMYNCGCPAPPSSYCTFVPQPPVVPVIPAPPPPYSGSQVPPPSQPVECRPRECGTGNGPNVGNGPNGCNVGNRTNGNGVNCYKSGNGCNSGNGCSGGNIINGNGCGINDVNGDNSCHNGNINDGNGGNGGLRFGEMEQTFLLKAQFGDSVPPFPAGPGNEPCPPSAINGPNPCSCICGCACITICNGGNGKGKVGGNGPVGKKNRRFKSDTQTRFVLSKNHIKNIIIAVDSNDIFSDRKFEAPSILGSLGDDDDETEIDVTPTDVLDSGKGSDDSETKSSHTSMRSEEEEEEEEKVVVENQPKTNKPSPPPSVPTSLAIQKLLQDMLGTESPKRKNPSRPSPPPPPPPSSQPAQYQPPIVQTTSLPKPSRSQPTGVDFQVSRNAKGEFEFFLNSAVCRHGAAGDGCSMPFISTPPTESEGEEDNIEANIENQEEDGNCDDGELYKNVRNGNLKPMSGEVEEPLLPQPKKPKVQNQYSSTSSDSTE